MPAPTGPDPGVGGPDSNPTGPDPAVAGPRDPQPPPVIAEVAVAVPIGGGDGLYDYRVPSAIADQVRPGVRLAVPLTGRVVEGFCVRCKPASDVAPERLKDVAAVIDPRPVYPEVALDLAVWTARRYLCQPGEVLRAAGPSRRLPGPRFRARLAVAGSEAEETAARLAAKASVQAALLVTLVRGPAEPAALRRRLGPQVPRALKSLVEKGLVTLEAVATRGPRRAREKTGPDGAEKAGPDGAEKAGPDEAEKAGAALPAARAQSLDRSVKLSPAQEAAFAAIASTLGGAEEATFAAIAASLDGAEGGTGLGRAGPAGRVFLLHGVTGSGKTEVYLRAAAETLALGRQALLLVPEVALVPQTLALVKGHLGSARVVVAHSYLGGRERLASWERIADGSADVVVGARSAVFAPLSRLGLIVLDEEHEDAYKQEEGAPRYHAREVAVRRAEREGATLILASATPSLESYHRAIGGEYRLVTLSERIGGRPLPPVEIVDMRRELASGNRGLFSRTLQKSLSEVLSAGRQVILFLNRRGHSTFILCRDCGWVARCPQCDVSLTYHHPRVDLVCHYCGHHAPAPDRCPGCGGHRVRYFGAGTQRIEDEVRLLYPETQVVRLDADVVSQAGEVNRVLALFESGQAQVLVGTQMVAKGLDVPGVGLVAAVAADSALHLPDFRAPEKTFRLLTQAAGRAGRGDFAGRVVVQTYNPDHPAVSAAATHDYLTFARTEMEARRALGYPPWSHLVRVESSHADETLAKGAATALAEALASLGSRGGPPAMGSSGRTRFAGPAPAPLARLKGRFRWHVLVFCQDLEEGLAMVKEAVRRSTGREARGGRRRPSGSPVTLVDVDPVSVL